MTRLDPAPTRRMALECLAVGMLARDLGIPRADAATAAAPSDLAQAMAWAMDHAAWLNRTAGVEHWDDDRLNEELDKYDAVYDRVMVEPAHDLADLRAKAVFVLDAYEDSLLLYGDREERAEREAELDAMERMLRALLQEVIHLCA